MGIQISEYHQRKFKKCPFCDKECKRCIVNGRNKGHQKTCGSRECIKLAINRPDAVVKKTHHGLDHPKWISDRSQVKFRPRYELTEWRNSVFRRDNYTCQICGQHGGRLQAHHIKGYKQYPDLRWDLNNGVTLCVECHKKTDNYGSRGRDSNSGNVEGTTDSHGYCRT